MNYWCSEWFYIVYFWIYQGKYVIIIIRNNSMKKGIKVRIYPNATQKNLIEQVIGNDRFLWNYLLDNIKNNVKMPNKYELITSLPKLKDKFEFLKLSVASSLQAVCEKLSDSFKSFFKGVRGYPNFHSKRYSKKSFVIKNNANGIRINHNSIRLPKLGYMKAKWDNSVNYTVIKRVTLSKTPTGKYYVSLIVDYESQELAKTNEFVGIDVGKTHLAILSNGDKIPSLDLSNLEAKLKYWQRKMSRRYELAKVRGISLEDSKGYQKAKLMACKYHEKIKNKRLDYLHNVTKEIVESYDLIAIEDIKVKSFLNKSYSNKSNHKTVNQSWYTFRLLLEYKCEMYSKELIIVDLSYTSKTCSCCGYINHNLKLYDRVWTCPNCNETHDRDINASINILNRALDSVGHALVI